GKTYDYLFKLLLIGDSGVGKTCVLFRFSEDHFNSTFISTIGIDFKIRTIDLDGKKVKLQIWYSEIHDQHCKKTLYFSAHHILLVLHLTFIRFFSQSNADFKHSQHASSDVEKMVLGNKCDMTEKRQVSKEQGERLAIEYGIKFMETSAKQSLNVEEAFFTLARSIKAKMDNKMVSGSDSPHSNMTTIHVKASVKKTGFFGRFCSIL
uniref:RAB8A, member RAS oncogene family n=1 Tax=Ciona savignyi TaxID=51511 RepID=H2YIZ9_CIOSA